MSINNDSARRQLENPKILNLQDTCRITSHTPHARVVSRVTYSTIICVCVFVYYMVCGRIDIRARVNYFSRNSEPRYRLRNPCATGYASKVNIMHFSFPFYPYPLPPPTSLLLSPFSFFSALAIFERDKGRICREAKLDKTLHPTLPATKRCLAELSECYKRVRARAIRQRRVTPFRERHCRRVGFRVSSILCHRSGRHAKENSRGNVSNI